MNKRDFDKLLADINSKHTETEMRLRKEIADQAWDLSTCKENFAVIVTRTINSTFTGTMVNPSRIIVIDTESTGVNVREDEIIQVSIIDGDGNEMLNDYVRPYFHSEWDKATEVNHITPEMVADSPFLHEVAPDIVACFESADTVLIYNADFDMSLLRNLGVDLSRCKFNVIDVMIEYAEFNGEWNEKYQEYKWKKLTEASQHFGYQYNAHDSLEDCRATLYVWKQLHKDDKR